MSAKAISLMRLKFLLLGFYSFSLISCSRLEVDSRNTKEGMIISENPKADSDYYYYNEKDYTDHLLYLEKVYQKSARGKIYLLGGRSKDYLEKLSRKIIEKNIFLFGSLYPKKFQFYIVNEKRPFHFSLPNFSIYLSSGLVEKYIDSEETLASILVFELIRSAKLVYEKKAMVPIGYLSTRRFVAFLKIPFSEKLQMNNWSFYCLRRGGIDPFSYLLWIQVQNKNTFDFALNLGDIQNISKEEASLKSFIVKNRFSKDDDFFSIREIPKSRGYRYFIEDFKKITF